MRFYFADKLHGTYLGRTAQGSGRESVDKGLERICSVVQSTADAAHQMDDMAVVLGFFVEYYPYVVAIPAEIVACQVHQHYMFCVFFRISQKSFRQFLVFDGVSRAACGAGNRVDICLSAFHFAMRFG